MYWTATTLKELAAAIDSAIVAVGEDAPVGVFIKGKGAFSEREPDAISDYVILNWVCIKRDGEIAGTEAEDYEKVLKPGECNAIAIL